MLIDSNGNIQLSLDDFLNLVMSTSILFYKRIQLNWMLCSHLLRLFFIKNYSE